MLFEAHGTVEDTYLVVPGSEVLHLHCEHSYAHQFHCGGSLLVLSQCWCTPDHPKELDQFPGQSGHW